MRGTEGVIRACTVCIYIGLISTKSSTVPPQGGVKRDIHLNKRAKGGREAEVYIQQLMRDKWYCGGRERHRYVGMSGCIYMGLTVRIKSRTVLLQAGLERDIRTVRVQQNKVDSAHHIKCSTVKYSTALGELERNIHLVYKVLASQSSTVLLFGGAERGIYTYIRK